MSFKYINPGYGALIDTEGVTTVENSTYNPKNGVAFKKVQSGNNSYVKINLPEGLTSDLYCKFDLYNTGKAISGLYFGDYRSDSVGSESWMTGIKINSGKVYISTSSNSLGNGQSLKYSALNKIWFHIHFGTSVEDSFGELKVNNNEKETILFSSNKYVGYYPFNSSYKEFIIVFPSSGMYGDYSWLSNFIISNEEIDPKEEVITLAVSEIETDMTENDGIFTAKNLGETIFQSVDTSALIEEYGGDSQVTGINLIGNPAYKTGTELSSVIAVSKNNDAVTEYGTHVLNDDTSNFVWDGRKISDMTISDFNGLKFGWKVGT